MLAEIEVKSYGTMFCMDETGDTRLQWDPSDNSEVAKAEARFNELIKNGFRAYRLNPKGNQGEILDKFDPTAERIIMHGQMVGG